MTHPDDQPAAVIKRELWARLDEVMRPVGSKHETDVGPTTLGDWLGDRVYAALLEAGDQLAAPEVTDETLRVAGEENRLLRAERDNALAEVARLRARVVEAVAEVDRQWCANVEACTDGEMAPAAAATITQLRAERVEFTRTLDWTEAGREALAAQLTQAEKVLAGLALDASTPLPNVTEVLGSEEIGDRVRAKIADLAARLERAEADADRFRRDADRSWKLLTDARTACKRLTAALIANASLLDVQFTNSALSPWSRSIKPAIERLRWTLGMRGGAPCCDLHNRNCEPPSELCCEYCTEQTHPGHADGSVCIAPDLSRATPSTSEPTP